jgi:hypothetical protein
MHTITIHKETPIHNEYNSASLAMAFLLEKRVMVKQFVSPAKTKREN